jgi:hypothetical protein
LKNEIKILVNADIVEYAIGYELKIDEKERLISLKLLDSPLLGESFMSGIEIEGSSISY